MGIKPLVFIDIETTGLSPRSGGRVLEVGALRVENNKIVKQYKQLIHPNCYVPSFITKITGIKNQDIIDAPFFEQTAKNIEELCQDAVFVAHNVNFDYTFIQHEFAALGKKFSQDRLCTVRLSRLMFPEYRHHKLDNIIERHGFNVQNRHRAYDDAEILYKFYMHLLKKDEITLFNAIQKTMVYCR